MLLYERIESIEEGVSENINIDVLKGVNNIKFGMSRRDIKTIMKITPKQFKKTKTSDTLVDDYGKYHVYFNHEDKCEAVEIFLGDFDVKLNGSKIDVSLKYFKDTFKDLEYVDGVYISTSNSIGIEVSGEVVKSILIGAHGYYK